MFQGWLETAALDSRQFNPGENLPRIIFLNISKRNIESAKRKQDIKRILYRSSANSPSKIFPWKVQPQETSSPWEIFPRGETPSGKFPFDE